jgi:uridine kinase
MRELVDLLAAMVAARRLVHPVRVGIDGPSAAGKTTSADALGIRLGDLGKGVVRASIDDFHRPGHKFRSMRGEFTPQTYYDESYDYAAFRDLTLRPCGPDGHRVCRPRLFDSFHDVAFPEEWVTLDEDAVLLVDGAFLQRPELQAEWDLLIWLDVDVQTILSREKTRDVAWVGAEGVVIERYLHRIIPSHALYETEVCPRERADVVVNTRDLGAPNIETIRVSEPVPFSDGVVVLDRLTAADAEAQWSGEDKELARRFGWYPRRSTLEGVRGFLRATEDQWRIGGSRRTWAIRLTETRQLVGGCEARLKPGRIAELSWWIFPEHRSRGLATRGVQLMILYLRALAGVRSFSAHVEPDNPASLGVARKAGFVSLDPVDTHEGRLMRHFERHGWSSPRPRVTQWVTQATVHVTPPQKEIDMVSQERLDHLAQFTDEHLAYHEAGHAVVHHLQGGTIVRLSIERTDPHEGMQPAEQPTPSGSADQQKALRDLVALLVAGEVAATVSSAPQSIVRAGGRVDREHAIRRAAEVGVDEAAARAMIEAEWPRVRDRLEEPANWKLVDSLAQQLVRQKVLDADQIRATLTA